MSRTLSELADGIWQVGEIYASRFGIDRTADWHLLKLTEELGEMTAEHLAVTGRTRQGDEDASGARQRLEDEAADLLGQFLLYVRANSIDIESAIERKWLKYLDKQDDELTLTIRRAERTDAATVFRFIRALAEYEKLLDKVDAREDDIARDLFGPEPRVFCEIAEWGGEPVGFALWFYTYSTFRGRHGIWLEDLFVDPEHRGKGIGKALMIRLAQRCAEEGLPRFAWWVLNWNQPSIDFYRAMGAVLLDEWTVCRVEGEALTALAAR